jgi:hypothetical protein
MALIPGAASKLGRDVKKSKILLIGQPKVGKTTLATSEENTLLIATEVGYETISGIYPVLVSRWEQFLEVLEELKGRKDITRIVIDTFSKLAKFGQRYACEQLEVEHPADAAYGKGFDRVNETLLTGMTRLMALGKQVVFIAHTKERVEKKNGTEKTIITVDLPAGAARFIQAECDAIVYYTKEEDPMTMAEKRVLYFGGNDQLEIGGRYLPGSVIPKSIFIPAPPAKGWPLVEEVLVKGFMPPNAVAEVPAGRRRTAATTTTANIAKPVDPTMAALDSELANIAKE